jgi:predicted Zn finger-like uncharacterized protein
VRFYCPGCQASFTVPDEKIPKGRTQKIPCPKCHTPMEEKEEQPGVGRPREDEGPLQAQQGAPAEYIEEEEGVPLDLVEEGVLTALVCVTDPARSEHLRDVFQKMDYYVVTATRAPFALAKLRHNRYDLVLLEESFEQINPHENLVLHHVQLLPMHARRTFFLCLLSAALPTMDRMTAYRMGVDMILNMRDFDNVKIILPRAMKEHRTFYSVFADEMNRKGFL